jgi:arylsulfatase A-like enzyme
MAPHDWTGEGMRYGDLHDVSSIDAQHAKTVTGNIPCRTVHHPKPASKPGPGDGWNSTECSRELDWDSMCLAMPYWKGKEMKRSYYSCISYVDYMIGELVMELKAVHLYEHTTVVFWTDHVRNIGCV